MVQIEPVVLFADNASLYNGKVHETNTKIREIVSSLPKLQALVIFEEIASVKTKENLGGLKPPTGSAYTYQSFLERQVLLSILKITTDSLSDHQSQTQPSPPTNSHSSLHHIPSISYTAPVQPANQNASSTLPSAL